MFSMIVLVLAQEHVLRQQSGYLAEWKGIAADKISLRWTSRTKGERSSTFDHHIDTQKAAQILASACHIQYQDHSQRGGRKTTVLIRRESTQAKGLLALPDQALWQLSKTRLSQRRTQIVELLRASMRYNYQLYVIALLASM